ncbi:MAG: HAMP domain-containing protein, partial [Spirochaetota bacterium]
MKIKTKIFFITGVVFLSVLIITSISILTLNEITTLMHTIDRGVELIAKARSLHGLMKDLMFDIFTPQTYRLLKDILHTPRFNTTFRNFKEAVFDLENAYYLFMESPRIKDLIRDDELRDTYAIAKIMSSKAFEKITSFQNNLDDIVASGVLGEESIYKQMQTGQDPSIPLFFAEVRDTSYYLTNSFESFLNHFIRSLQDESVVIRRQILLLFWTLTALVGFVTVILSLVFARKISRRIRSVEEGFRRVSTGDFTEELNIRTRDEFGLLASNFNLFMKDLKRNVDSVLNLTRDVGKSITGRLDFQKILELIVESAVNDSNADGAAVFMTGDKGVPEVQQVAGILAGKTLSDYTWVFLGEIFDQGQPTFLRDVQAMRFFHGHPAAPAVNSLLALPLIVSGRVLAVLCVVTSGDDHCLTDLDYT